MATFQERLKELRKAQNLKQSELAEKLGVSMYTVSVWERGERKPEYDNLDALCDVLNVNLGYLLGTNDDPTPPGVLSDADLARWADEDEMEALKNVFSRMTQLNQGSKRIITAAIIQAFKEDRESGTLEAGYEVEVRPLSDFAEQSEEKNS